MKEYEQKIEQEFLDEYNKVFKQARQEINKKIDIAAEALDEAVEIAEKYGISFYSSISPLGQMYTAESMQEKWIKKWDEEKYFALKKHLYIGETGWEHSAICY